MNMEYEKIKSDFYDYMINEKHLKDSSASQYLDVIDYTSKDAIEDGILDRSIYDYSNANEVRDILDTLRQNDRFNTITFERNHVNTAAVGNYISFLEYKNQTSVNEASSKDQNKSSNFLDAKDIEKETEKLIKRLIDSTNANDKAVLTKEIMKNCYLMLNYYK